MYHATNQTVEYKETGRSTESSVKGVSNLKNGGDIFKGLLYSFFITPMTVKLRVLTRPASPFTADISSILFACLMYMCKNVFAYFSALK